MRRVWVCQCVCAGACGDGALERAAARGLGARQAEGLQPRSRRAPHKSDGARGGGGLQPDVAARPLDRTRARELVAGGECDASCVGPSMTLPSR